MSVFEVVAIASHKDETPVLDNTANVIKVKVVVHVKEARSVNVVAVNGVVDVTVDVVIVCGVAV